MMKRLARLLAWVRQAAMRYEEEEERRRNYACPWPFAAEVPAASADDDLAAGARAPRK